MEQLVSVTFTFLKTNVKSIRSIGFSLLSPSRHKAGDGGKLNEKR